MKILYQNQPIPNIALTTTLSKAIKMFQCYVIKCIQYKRITRMNKMTYIIIISKYVGRQKGGEIKGIRGGGTRM